MNFEQFMEWIRKTHELRTGTGGAQSIEWALWHIAYELRMSRKTQEKRPEGSPRA
jgi:hypothetical protein